MPKPLLDNMRTNVLTKEDIIHYLRHKKLAFTPVIDELQLQEHSVDMRLGYTFMIPKRWHLTTKGREALLIDYSDNSERFERIELTPGQYFDILPKESIVVASLEEITMPNDLMGVLYPRSSVNRRGLTVEMSGIVDAGYIGNLYIPVTNNTDNQVIRVYPGERFCQLVFHNLGKVLTPRKSRWHKNNTIMGRKSELKKDEEVLILKGEIDKLKKKHKVVY